MNDKGLNIIYSLKQLHSSSWLWLFLLPLFVSCKKESAENPLLAQTTMFLEDPYRKYYPVQQGQKLNVVVKVENTGEKPLKIFNVLPSCGCTLVKYPKAIAPGRFGLIQMEYNSNKNLGHVGIYTTLIANTPERTHTIYFETNVVPNSLYIKDYEELYFEEKRDEKGFIQEAVEGKANERGYIIFVDSTEVRKYK